MTLYQRIQTHSFRRNLPDDEWKEEAKKRGLSIYQIHDAIKALFRKKLLTLFKRNEVLNARELQADCRKNKARQIHQENSD